MRKKEVILIAIMVILGGLYVHYFVHWFDKRGIAISASVRPNRRRGGDIVVFTLNDGFRLTSVEVLAMDGDKPLPNPVWHLVSDSNSPPIRVIRYGLPVPGMKPAIKGVHADPLQPGSSYRLLLAAGNASGTKDFKMPQPQ